MTELESLQTTGGVDFVPLLYLIAFVTIVLSIVWMAGSDFAKKYLPYCIRRWISMDGFFEGYTRTAPKKKRRKSK